MVLVKKLQTSNPALHGCLEDIRKFCIECWNKPLLPWFTNHDYRHSEIVISLLGELLKPFEHHPNFLDDQELFVLLASAYLHDIGMQYLKVDDISIDRLSQSEYDLIRKRHAEESFNIIHKAVQESLGRDDFHLPKIDEAYLPAIAYVSKGHSTDFFDEVINKFRTNPETPKGRIFRGELLTSLLLLADELDLQGARIDFAETAKFNLSAYSRLHWFKHHYIERVNIINGSIEITFRFPSNAEEYKDLFKDYVEAKLKEQLAKVNPILREFSSGILHLAPDIKFVFQPDDFGAKRHLPAEVLAELKKEVEKEELSCFKETGSSLQPMTTYPKPSQIFTGMIEERRRFQELLSKANFISIEGAGGFGKTEFAAKCINEFIQKDKVVWFDCLSESKLDSLIGLAGYANVLKGENKTELAKFSSFTDLIESDEKVLFLDNFHDVADPSFKEFFKFAERRINKAKIILLTREHPNIGVRFGHIDIEGLKDAAFDFAKKLKDTFYFDAVVTDSELQDICNKVDGYPLAIELALQLISYGESTENIVKKIVHAHDKSTDLSHRLLDEIFIHPKSTELEKKFMLLFSVFRGDVDKKAISYLLDDEETDATLRKLFDKKMIARSGDRLSTHPLVKEFCYKKLEKKHQAHFKASEYLKTLRTDKFDALLEEEISHHLLSGEYFEALADLISEKGGEFILTGNTNFLREIIDKTIAKGISRPVFYVFYGDIETIRGEWDRSLELYEKAFSHQDVTNEVTTEAYIKYGETLFRKGEIKDSLRYFEDAYKMSKTNYKKEEARSMNDIGLVYIELGELATANKILNDALQIRISISDKVGIADTLNNIGNALNSEGLYTEAQQKYLECLKIRKDINDRQGEALAITNLGNVLRTVGKLNESLDKKKETLTIAREISDKLLIANALNGIGAVYGDLATKGRMEYREAINKFSESLKIAKEIGAKSAMADVLGGIGSVYFNMNKFKDALLNFKKSLEIYESIGQKQAIASILNNMANCFDELGNKEAAADFYNKSLQLYEEVGNKHQIRIGHFNSGMFFTKQKKYATALKHLFNSFALSKQLNLKGTEKELIVEIRKIIGYEEFMSLAKKAFDSTPDNLKAFTGLDDFTLDATVNYEAVEKVGRNAPCPCGSGKKYKKCHGK